MTTATCVPCEMAATATEDVVPETDGAKTASWSGPIGMEGHATGDGRFIQKNALRWDTLPVPLRWVKSDVGAHDGAVVVGKIEDIERLSYEEANERLVGLGREPLPDRFEDATIIWGSGTNDLGSEEGREAFRQVDEDLTPGISMDLDDILISEGDPGSESFEILEGRIRAATQVAIPAFEGARIATSDPVEFDSAEERAETLNWVDDVGGLPAYIDRIRKDLQERGFAESHAIATAVNAVKRWARGGPAREGGEGHVSPATQAKAAAALAEWEAKKAAAGAAGEAEPFSLVAGAVVPLHKTPPASWFKDPGLPEPTGLTVTEDGRVFGHIALWGTCHIASPQGHGVCTQPPQSASNYAYFHTGMTATDKGDVATGKITMSTTHAKDGVPASDAVYHYEHTGAVGADVVAGQDSFGIWVAGAARPGADRVALKAAPISGDWRTIGGSLEMVAALSVNVPGFPVPRPRALVASGRVVSLVASGVVRAEERAAEVLSLDLNDDTAVRSLRERFRAMDRRDRADALAAQVARLAALEKVRRLAASIPRSRRVALAYKASRAAKFAYNPDQWRVPKGNGELSGRFIDMPDSLIADLENALHGIADSPNTSMDDGTVRSLGESLGDAEAAAQKATAALKAADGDAATAAAKDADAALSSLEQSLQDAVDGGHIDEGEAAALGDALHTAREGIDAVAESDLSLLGDEGPGADDVGGVNEEKPVPKGGAGDIGAGDAGDSIGGDTDGDASKATPAPGGGASSGGAMQPGDIDEMPAGSLVEVHDPGTGEVLYKAAKNPDGTWRITDSSDPEEVPVGLNVDTDDLAAGGDYDVVEAPDAPAKAPGDVLTPAEVGALPPGSTVDSVDPDGGISKAVKNPDGTWEITESDQPQLVGQQVDSDDLNAGGDNEVRVAADNTPAPDEPAPPEDGPVEMPTPVDDAPPVEDGPQEMPTPLPDPQDESERAKQTPDGFPEDWSQDTRAPFPTYYDAEGDYGVTQDEDSGRWFPIAFDPADEDVKPVRPDGTVMDWDERPETYDTPQEALGAAEKAKASYGDEPYDPADADVPEPDGGDGAGEAPDGVSQAAWDALTPEQRDAVSSQIADGVDPAEAVQNAKGAPEPPDGGADAAPDLFEASDGAEESASRMEQTLQDAIDSGGWTADQDSYSEMGGRLDAAREAVSDLQAAVRDGSAKPDAARDALKRAQDALSLLEGGLMDAADQPGAMDDGWANQIGTALDDLFASLAQVESSLNNVGMTPPPFAGRSYVRQWLGRRGIRLGSLSLI